MLAPLGIERTLVARLGGSIWLVAGITLLAAGLGAFGLVVPHTWWRSLALIGAVISLVMLTVYFHPLFGIGIGASIVLLIALLWEQGAQLTRLGL